jgi:hypothetical protein
MRNGGKQPFMEDMEDHSVMPVTRARERLIESNPPYPPCRDAAALIAELRDLQAALSQHDDETLCLKLMLMAASRRAEIQARKREP